MSVPGQKGKMAFLEDGMTGLLEIREKVKFLYSRYEIFILPVIKFLLAFLVLNTLNGRMGYMTRLDNIAIVLIVALMCSFLPTEIGRAHV